METKVISVCKKDKRSRWANGAPRNTSKGMKMVVRVGKDKKGNRNSQTHYITGE